MILVKAIKVLRSYVVFLMPSEKVGEINNLAMEYKISLWDISKKGSECTAKTFADSYKRLCRACKEKRIKIRLKKKRGLRFFLFKYRKRWGFVIGIILMITAITVSQNFVWVIEAQGNKTIEEKDILAAAKKLGIHIGAYKSNLDLPQISRELAFVLPDAAWVAVNIKGTKITVKVTEREKPPSTTTKSPYYNVVAAKEGRITKIQAFSGQPSVQVGDSVLKGDLLINPLVDFGNGETRTVNADGIVLAETTLEKTIKIPLEHKVRNYTGKERSAFDISLFGFEFKTILNFEKDTAIEVTKEKELFSIFTKNTPFSIKKINYKKFTESTVKYTEKEAAEIAEKTLKTAENKELSGKKILSKNKTSFVENNTFVLNVNYVLEENIAQKIKFLEKN